MVKLKKAIKKKELKEPKEPKVVIKIEKEKEWLGPTEKDGLLILINVFGIPFAINYIEKLYEKHGKNYFDSKNKEETKGKSFFENLFESSDPYGINKLKTKKEVKDRCNELYLMYHPDRQGGDSKKFIEIKEICNKKKKTFK